MVQHLKGPAKAGAKFAKFTVRARRDERGVVAIWFGLVLAFMIPLIMVGINLHMASNEKLKLQDALDAATLAAARSPYIDEASLTKVGKDALIANLRAAGRPTEETDFSEIRFWTNDRQTVQSSVDMKSNALLSSNIGHSSVGAGSQVMRAVSRLEIALVLDTTGSMQGNDKIGKLKTAAKNFVTKITEAASYSPEEVPVRFSLVPFSNTVRVPLVKDALRSNNKLMMTSYNGSNQVSVGVREWVDPKAKQHWSGSTNNDIFSLKSGTTNTDRFSLLKAINQPWNGCLENRRPDNDISGDKYDAAKPATAYVPYFWPDEPDTPTSGSGQYFNNYLTDGTSSSDWKTRLRNVGKYTGSIKSGTISTSHLGSSYGKTYYLGPNAGCELSPMVPLTEDGARIKTVIDDMNPMGETNIPFGLAWGWNMLQPNYSYFGLDALGRETKALPYEASNLQKVVVLMTDGQNTFSSMNGENKSIYGGLGYFWQNLLGGTGTNRTSRMDGRLSSLCTKMKNAGIIIYAIRVEVNDDEDTTLKNCAGVGPINVHLKDEIFYYEVKDSNSLNSVFLNVAGSITSLRVSK